MTGNGSLETLYVVTAFLFQLILIIHFALRKWRFDVALRSGWIVYLLSVPAALVSVILLLGGMTWSFWLGGFLYFAWAAYGYSVEYVKKIEWRSPVRWSVFGPYLVLYLATVMFYWWPLALIDKSWWYVYTLMFIISTFLNITSHKDTKELN